MATLAQLQAQLDKLVAARASGTQTVGYGDKHVTFRSVTEINDAIAQIRADMSLAGGSQIVRTFRFQSEKDL